jgi:hypothetical protein
MMLGRDFSLFFIGATLSAIGTAMVPVALSFAILGAGHSAGALGIVLAAQTGNRQRLLPLQAAQETAKNQLKKWQLLDAVTW